MIHTRIFTPKDEAGITTFWHFDDATDIATIQSVQDVDDIIEDNKAAYNSVDERSNWKGDLHLVGRIPMLMLNEMQQQGLVDREFNVIDHEEVNKRVAKFLNDRDNLAWRVRPGRI